jgi:hypothetical protein
MGPSTLKVGALSGGEPTAPYYCTVSTIVHHARPLPAPALLTTIASPLPLPDTFRSLTFGLGRLRRPHLTTQQYCLILAPPYEALKDVHWLAQYASSPLQVAWKAATSEESAPKLCALIPRTP